MNILIVFNCRLTKIEHGRMFDLGPMTDFSVLPNSTQVFKKVGDVDIHVGTLNKPLGEGIW